MELYSTMIGEDERREEKVQFDMRLQYYDILKKVMLATKLSAIEGDLQGFYRGLRESFIMVQAYVNEDQARLIGEKLQRAKMKTYTLNVVKGGSVATFRNQLEELLYEIDADIHEAAKAVYLPLGGGESDEVDWEHIRRQS